MDAPLYDVNADARIIRWRFECFEALGFTALGSSSLAVRRDIDRARVARMVQGGCPHHQVLAIVL